jgi:hypothetical protein
MKKILICCLILILLVSAALGSPLVFKATKEVKNGETAELGAIDCTKYKQIRIGLIAPDSFPPTKDEAESKLAGASEEHRRAKGLFERGVYSKAQLDAAQEALVNAYKTFQNAETLPPIVFIYGVEAVENILINSFKAESRSIVIDSPPSKLIVKVSGSGTYKIFVWASM